MLATQPDPRRHPVILGNNILQCRLQIPKCGIHHQPELFQPFPWENCQIVADEVGTQHLVEQVQPACAEYLQVPPVERPILDS